MTRLRPFLAVSASPDQAITIAKEKLSGGARYKDVGYLNLGMFSQQKVADDLPALLSGAGLGVIMHTLEINLNARSSDEDLMGVRKQAEILNADWLETDLGVWKWGNMFLGSQLMSPLLNDYDIQAASEIYYYIQRKLNRPFVYENPPVYFSHEEMGILEYMSKLCRPCGAEIALDVSHLTGYCINTDRNLGEYIESWDGWDLVVELHLTGYDTYQINGLPLWIDRHSRALTSFDWVVAEDIVRRCSNLKIITLEMEGAPVTVVDANITSAVTLLNRIPWEV